METTITLKEMLVKQGQNLLECIQGLKKYAKKKGRERTKVYERFCANRHSFNVYTYGA